MEVIYNAAASLDGCIATLDGGVEWLAPFEGTGEDYGIADFYQTIDVLVMGSTTYEFALAQDEWISPDKPSWVLTRRSLPSAHPNVTLSNADPKDVVESLQALGFERIWLMGGGRLAASFQREGLITEYQITVIPVLLGKGIHLLEGDSAGENSFCRRCNAARNSLKGPPVRGVSAAAFSLAANASRPCA